MLILATLLGIIAVVQVVGRIIGTNMDFLKGFSFGIGIVLSVAAIVIFVFRIKGRSAALEADEREQRIAEKSGLAALVTTAFAMVFFLLASYASPALKALEATYVVAGILLFMALSLVISKIVYSTRM